MGISTKSPISHLLIVRDLQVWYQINAKTWHILCHGQICKLFMIICLNINLNVRNERKMVIKLRGCTFKITHIVAANILTLTHLVPTYS